MLLKLGSTLSRNARIQALQFIHGYQRFILYSTESDPSFSTYLSSSLGFSKQQSLSISAKLSQRRLAGGTKQVSDFNFAANADSVIEFIKKHGFDESHIRKIVSCEPRILISNVDKTLKPKIKVLEDFGCTGSQLVHLLSKNTLFWRRDSGPTIRALKQVLGSNENVIVALSRLNQRMFPLVTKYLSDNVALLENDYGVSINIIRQHMLRGPVPFMVKTQVFKDALIRTETKLGIPRNCAMFLYGVRLLVCCGEENIESKCQTIKSFGWTETDVRALIKQAPNVLSSSAERIRKSLQVLMEELGYEPADLLKQNCMLTCSIEKRIVPRHKVLLVLKDKGFVKRDYPLHSAVKLNESKFVKQFVLPFQEVHEVYAKLTGYNVDCHLPKGPSPSA